MRQLSTSGFHLRVPIGSGGKCPVSDCGGLNRTIHIPELLRAGQSGLDHLTHRFCMTEMFARLVQAPSSPNKRQPHGIMSDIRCIVYRTTYVLFLEHTRTSPWKHHVCGPLRGLAPRVMMTMSHILNETS